MSTLLIENGFVVTVNDQQQIHQPGYVFIEDDLITAIGSGESPSTLKKADTIADATNMAVMPGMINAHTHLFQTFVRGLADDKPLLEWLEAAIWPVAQALTEEDAYIAAMIGMVENIRGGVTSLIDHQYVHTEPGNDDAVCRAADESGVRFLLARGWADIDYHPVLMEDEAQIISETTRLRQKWQSKGNGRIRIEFGPLIPWGCSDETMVHTHAISQDWGAGTHIHVAETKIEVDMNLQSRGNRHIEWLAELGVLGPDMQLVHSIWLDDNEIDLIARHKAIVVHCPVSNMYLASGVAQIPQMRQKGITIALGSDGPGSNNSQNMLEVLKTTILLQKVNTLDATVLLPEDVIWMACRGGAEAFGLPDLIGSLEVGKKADLTLINLDTPLAMPVHRVPSALVYNMSPRDVHTVIVDGRILMQNKEILFLDETALLAKARKTCSALFQRAGVKVQ